MVGPQAVIIGHGLPFGPGHDFYPTSVILIETNGI